MIQAPEDLRLWLTGQLIPGWVERTYRPDRPGFVETLTPEGEPDLRDMKTTLVTARLVYAFSHGHCLDPAGPSLVAARHGFAFLLEQCRDSEGRFCHAVKADGTIIDGRSDLYDLAFVLFALAWFFRATGEAYVLTIAEEIMRFIETTLGHPWGGFAEDTDGKLPRRQNPHMHLLEACHALSEVSPDPRWLVRADGLVRLMRDHLYDKASGSVGEFFSDDWKPIDGPDGQRREPGHQFEWVWLLYHHGRLIGDHTVRDMADRLYRFGLAHGRTAGDLSAAIIDAVNPQGHILENTKLLWPQTEFLKALTARIEFDHDASAAITLQHHLEVVFGRFIDSQSGIWINQLDAKNVAIKAALPLRVLYHLVLGFAEVSRVTSITR
jgi:mannose/cellobiose epimerase-like protein (N-acyl-D-glucosamine 2-epimerase family)